MLTRQNDYEHWVVCECGWRGFSADMFHGYEGFTNGVDVDVEPLDHCPECGMREYNCDIYEIVMRRELVKY